MAMIARRLCADCSRPLARDNCGDRCAPCARASKRGAPDSDTGDVNRHLRLPPSEGDGFGALLVRYRQVHGISQRRLGEILNLSQPQISKIERGAREVRAVAERRRIAAVLDLPTHTVLGTDSREEPPRDRERSSFAEHASVLVGTARAARFAGLHYEAASQLALVEGELARVSAVREDRGVARSLAAARLALGLTLGDILPEESLGIAAKYDAMALRAARDLEDSELLWETALRNGNELRKARRYSHAIPLLELGVKTAPRAHDTGTALVGLSRAWAETGDQGGFEACLNRMQELQTDQASWGLGFNPLVTREVEARGYLELAHRERGLHALERDEAVPDHLVSPQWGAIRAVTLGTVLLQEGEVTRGVDRLRAALITAERLRLPHQIQRALRALSGRLQDDGARQAFEEGRLSLARVRSFASEFLAGQPAGPRTDGFHAGLA
jgi:transcriptional regulator with XRE-family HTH domain